MKRKKTVMFIIMSGTMMLTTCTKDIGGPDVCFDQEILPVFISNCTMSGCHNPSNKEAGYDFTTYEGIMKGIVPKHPLQSEVFKSIKGKNPSMPAEPYPALSTKQVNTIKLWINMGAPHTTNCNSSCDTVNVSYTGRIQSIMTIWCKGCHNSSNPGGGYDLTSYANVKQATLSNKLPGSVEHLAGYVAMPQNGTLSSCDINAIRAWINKGMPEN